MEKRMKKKIFLNTKIKYKKENYLKFDEAEK